LVLVQTDDEQSFLREAIELLFQLLHIQLH
jgi:hypothetical protein